MSAQVNIAENPPIPAKKPAVHRKEKTATLNSKRPPSALGTETEEWDDSENAMIARVVTRAMKNAKKLGLEGKSRAEVTKMVRKSEDDYWNRQFEKILARDSKMLGVEETRKALKRHGLADD